jgi:hypothetical protein
MNEREKRRVLLKAKDWFQDKISNGHMARTLELKRPSKFDINPFLSVYLANFLCGDAKPESIAKALIYPRALGTSITTSFGQNIQSFTSTVLSSFGSTASGIDIEFQDEIDGIRRYCQLKAGPNTINHDDVETISGHFTSVINLGRTNNLRLGFDNLTVGVLYGEASDLNGHYQRITNQYHYPVLVGADFWKRLTGDPDFYADLIKALGSVANQANFSKELDEIVEELAKSSDIQELSKEAMGN